jgi:hypothetical protein
MKTAISQATPSGINCLKIIKGEKESNLMAPNGKEPVKHYCCCEPL